MYPTIQDGEIVRVSRMLTHIHNFERGDIVGITINLEGEQKHIIKRIIALPYENLKISDGKVYINNIILNESYLPTVPRTEGSCSYTLGENQYFVMGDNRNNSVDSRDNRIGLINKKDIDFIYVSKSN